MYSRMAYKAVSLRMMLRRAKIRVVEDGAENALGEQVLDEHFFDGRVRNIG